MNNQKIYIVMYHYVRDLANSNYPLLKGLDVSLFEKQLDFFEENFNIITMESLLEAIDSKQKLPDNSLLLTFDDGYIDNFQVVFPLLKKRNLQGSFFIPGKILSENCLLNVNKSHFILASADEQVILKDLKERMDFYRGKDFQYASTEELYEKYSVAFRYDTKDTIFIKRILQTVLPKDLRNIIASELFEKYVGIPEDIFAKQLYLNRNQIKQMKEFGMFIGLHGYSHCWMTDLTEKSLKTEIEKSLEVMSEFIDKDCWVMNYPYGDYNNRVINEISRKGCSLAITTAIGIADLSKDSCYKLPRLDCNDFPPQSNDWINR